VYKQIHEVLDLLPEIQWQMDSTFLAPPLPPAEDDTLLNTIQKVLVACGVNPEPIGVPYATDAGDLGSSGIPTIVLGPGDIAQAHTKDEWIAIEQLHKGVEVYQQIMATPPSCSRV
jgi:acetylornithine deacetylase